MVLGGCMQGTPEGVEDNGSLTRVAAFPIGIDPERFQRALERVDVRSHIAELLNRYAGRKVADLLAVHFVDAWRASQLHCHEPTCLHSDDSTPVEPMRISLWVCTRTCMVCETRIRTLPSTSTKSTYRHLKSCCLCDYTVGVCMWFFGFARSRHLLESKLSVCKNRKCLGLQPESSLEWSVCDTGPPPLHTWLFACR